MNQVSGTRVRQQIGSIALLLAIALPTTTLAQDPPSVELASSPAYIPFQLIDNRVVFSGNINESNDLVFVLDTGARATAVFGPIGDSLGLAFVGQARVGNGGEGVTAPVAIGASIGLGQGVEVTNEMVVALLEQDLRSRLGFPADGVTGAALFTNSIVGVDFEQGVISVHSVLPEIPDEAARIPVTIEDGGVPYAVVGVELADGTVFDAKVVVDLGQGQSMSLNVGSDPAIAPPDDAVYVAGYGVRIDGSDISGHFGRVAGLRLGDHELVGVISSFPDLDSQIDRAERQGSIGAEILRRFHVVFDYAAGYMYLTPNASFDDAFEIDMSGLRLSAEGAVVGVASVLEGSAGAEAGLRPGDEIIEVDGRRVTWTMLPEIRGLLRTHGRTLQLVVRRDGERHEAMLQLRRRV